MSSSSKAVRPEDYRVDGNVAVDLAALPTRPALAAVGNRKLRALLGTEVTRFATLQERLYAESRRALLLVFQGMDAAGKDSTVKHVTSGVNPQGFRITNFTRPTFKEMEYSWLQRHWPALPERGRIGIFNRSHYEEAVTLRVFPDLLAARKLPLRKVDDGFWQERLRDILAFERHLVRNGTTVVKFFLHVSKKEQKKRLLGRLRDPAKNWKFDPADMVARGRWDEYQRAYQAAFNATSTSETPWYIVPADHKGAMRAIVATIVVHALAAMAPRFPTPDAKLRREIVSARKALEAPSA